tara:strand:+ start:440 stop:1429 length:990 start_codon:yes stop_codon:yes gene_type:complete
LFDQSPTFLIPLINGILAGLITYFTYPLVNNIALRLGLVDNPSPRKQHNSPKVRIGGITIILGYIAVILLNIFCGLWDNYFFLNNSQTIYIVIAGIIMFFIGLTDDIKGTSPWSRLFFQIIISSLVWTKGLSINSINFSSLGILDLTINLNQIFSYLFTVIWLVGITNAFNWIDGLDGLAIGVSLISALSFSIIFFQIAAYEFVFLSSLIVGTSLGFLVNNYYPAKIFMGDGGAYFLGFSFGAMALYSPNIDFANKPFLPCVLILMFPLIDMASVIFRRIIQGRSPFYPDKTHFHHFLLNKGLNHKKTVLVLYCLSIIFSLSAFLLITY